MPKSKTRPHIHKTLRLDQNLYEEIEEYMEKTDKTFTEVVTTALKGFLVDLGSPIASESNKTFEEKKKELIRMIDSLDENVDINHPTPTPPPPQQPDQPTMRIPMDLLERIDEALNPDPLNPKTKVKGVDTTNMFKKRPYDP